MTTTTALRRRPPRGRRGLAAAADAIGIHLDELRAELRAGASVADVAEARGVAADAVVEALVDEFGLRLRAEVAAGRVTSPDAETLVAASRPGFVALVTSTPLRPLAGAA